MKNIILPKWIRTIRPGNMVPGSHFNAVDRQPGVEEIYKCQISIFN
jgi:hypothetical protein